MYSLSGPDRRRGRVSGSLITDRAEAWLVPCDEAEDATTYLPLIPASTTSPEPAGDRIACAWCGAYSARGAGCDSCGSPLS